MDVFKPPLGARLDERVLVVGAAVGDDGAPELLDDDIIPAARLCLGTRFCYSIYTGLEAMRPIIMLLVTGEVLAGIV